MLLFSIFIVSICILAAVCFQTWRHSKQLKKLLANKTAELNQLNKLEEKLQQDLNTVQNKLNLAQKDPVTQLPSWGFFEELVVHSIHESARYQFTMAILYVDINDFKVINDALGYETGNAVLNIVAQRLQASIRQVDSVSRLSKDIFVIMLTQLGKPETAAIVAQRILESLMQPVQIKEHVLYINACIGISIYPADGHDAQTLFRSADNALMLAKEKGRQNYQFYQQKMHADSLRELAISTGLKRESLMQEFAISYQPIMNVQTKTIFCMQALLQWQHPELGVINPEDLFNYAEKGGKSNLIFEWLLKQTCQQFLQWHSVGFQPELLSVSLSIKQLMNHQFVYRISQILQECNFKPEWLLIEIKESLPKVPYDSVEKAFKMLKYLNIKLAIADFGLGQFSIYELKKFGMNYLKLDQTFIFDTLQNEKAGELIKAILVLAQSLSAQVIVQGVDSVQQREILQNLGCALLQGGFVDQEASSPQPSPP